jgi:ketosteroid isomerase-like protein
MRLTYILIVGAVGIALCSLAPWKTSATKPGAAAPEAEIRQVIDSFFEAAKRQDWDRAAEVMSSDFVIYTDGAAGFDKNAYLKLLKEDDIETMAMQLRDMVIHVSGDGTMAWSQYRGKFTQVVRGKRSVTETAESLIFEKRQTAWKIVRAQASVKESGGGS